VALTSFPAPSTVLHPDIEIANSPSSTITTTPFATPRKNYVGGRVSLANEQRYQDDDGDGYSNEPQQN
jgi:hypothetical protein